MNTKKIFEIHEESKSTDIKPYEVLKRSPNECQT